MAAEQLAITTVPVRVLHLEDSPRDAQLIRDLLESDGLILDLLCVDTRAGFEAALGQGVFDLIICDFNLPSYGGLAAVLTAHERCPMTPVIVVSGSMDAGEAAECLRAGATDYVLKQRPERLPSAVARALQETTDRRGRERTEARLLASEERFRQLAEQSTEGFWFLGLNPERILYVSPAVETIWGVSAEALEQNPRRLMEAIHPHDSERVREAFERFASGEAPRFDEECRVVQKDGSARWVLTRGTPIRDEVGTIVRLSGLTQDVTERRELEARFLQAQKMDTVGHLAGGIAHDFNNLLTVINGTAEVALGQVRESDPLREDLHEILRAGRSAAGLTRQLLTFSRKQIVQPRVIDLHAAVLGMKGMLSRLLREDIEMTLVPPGVPALVKADPGGIEQVLTNLAVNARDAMPLGGELLIETRNVTLDDRSVRKHRSDLKAGPYVMLVVSDTGTGMDEDTCGRIFEPFFTTKEPDKGTGLGLSTVYGIVEQSGGFVTVTSKLGQGTTFEVCLPQLAQSSTVDEEPRPVAAARRGTETVLVVDDVEGIRRLVQRALGMAGYQVLTASGGQEALLVLQHHTAPVALILTDVVMPGMSGRDLAAHVDQKVKVVYMSGHTDDVVVRHGVMDEGTPFLAKPFTTEELLRKVREVLDSEA